MGEDQFVLDVDTYLSKAKAMKWRSWRHLDVFIFLLTVHRNVDESHVMRFIQCNVVLEPVLDITKHFLCLLLTNVLRRYVGSFSVYKRLGFNAPSLNFEKHVIFSQTVINKPNKSINNFAVKILIKTLLLTALDIDCVRL